MELIPVRAALLASGSDLAGVVRPMIEPQDICVVSSKAVATIENAFIDLTKLAVSDQARNWSAKTGRSPEFMEAVLRELDRLHGDIRGHCPGALLTEVRPEGLPKGSIFTANAGLDESNAPIGKAIGWPRDPVRSMKRLWETIKLSESFSFGIILSDSSCCPHRLGVTAYALVACGFEPLVPQAGRPDLFGRKLCVTTEAVADQLATAANILMGNADQRVPAVIVRDHGIPLSDFCGWVPGIEPEEDLFRGLLR